MHQEMAAPERHTYDETSTPREPESVINTRGGSVLGKKTILKTDHFPGCQNKRLQPQVEGAPNYRQVSSLPVYGVAIPTVDGIRRVLDITGASKNGPQRVLWHNLREEPVVYINGRPYVLREVERPFTNLEYTGINRLRVEQMEARLKEDIIHEAARFGNKVMVTDELPDGQMIDQWEPISRNSVQTPLEVYECLQAEGYLVDYERVPITDEKSPKERDFDILLQRLSQADIHTHIMFNCQMGRGRTSTGMVIATLVYLKRIGMSGIPRTRSFGQVLESLGNLNEDIPDSEEAIRRGEYTVIRSLIRVLEGGVDGKRQVDMAIDKCSAMQNLREAIAGYRNSIQRQADEKKREAALSLFVEYLERYYYLICFAVYIHTEQSKESSFQGWMKARPELYSILRRLLRRDPMGALSYGHNVPGLIKKHVTTINGCPSDMETVVALRHGEVLGRQTVLKSDHCPGCQNMNLPERVEGAPNFREVEGFSVYGVANPTIDGIRAVLHQVGGGKGGRPVLWHNMREEPVVYINGKPFVLREVERPYKNMLEYTGIDTDRVERMEARLKEDVLREAEQYNLAIMVNHETENGQIFDAWEPITPDAVQTPLQVFKSLESEGYLLDYARVPITDGKAPRSSDFDTLASKIASASPNTALVFNCQMGRGRTTTGTVIACLVKLRCEFGRPLKLPTTFKGTSEVDTESSSGDEGGDSGMEPDNGSTVLSAFELERQSSIAGFVMDDIPVMRKITRILENGTISRSMVDAIIDRCAMMQNLRLAILHYRKVFNHQNLEHHRRRGALNRGAEYLERYVMLIAFTQYLGSEFFDGYCNPVSASTAIPFKAWLHRHPEIRELKWSMRLRPAQVFTIPEIDYKTSSDGNEVDAVMEAVVKSRNGSVLGKGSILKMYFFPGQKKTSNFVDVPGAPHVCKVDSVPVYSSATPTVDGAKAVLAYLSVEAGVNADQSPHKAIVIDLREEVVVYIHGNPFVLRELEQPVNTLKHVGITGSAVQQMEKRLKEDILAQAARSGGRILLHREQFNPVTNRADIIGYWETIGGADVWTVAEMYAALKIDGYNIEYKRIPLTREREALATDVDAIQRCIGRMDDKVKYLFISHTGYGGVAYAMAITCLKLEAEMDVGNMEASSSAVNRFVGKIGLFSPKTLLQSYLNDENAFMQGDYRDILSLTRVLADGPSSKAEVDKVTDRCSQAGNLREDIFYYMRQLKGCKPSEEDLRIHLLDMGLKALRRYFFLIAFRSYLSTWFSSASQVQFADWMNARPELAHLYTNLKLQ